MQVVEKFGRCVDELSENKPLRARQLLMTGWSVQDVKYMMMPDKRLIPADRYLAKLMMDTMLRPIKNPEKSAIVSVFTPCELLQEAGLYPYNVESMSCYLSASKAEKGALQQAEGMGISETLCSYHKTFIGAAGRGLLPPPSCIIYTNLVCDANLLTFRALAEFYKVPYFYIDVPMHQTREDIQYVADQLKELKNFLERHTGVDIDEDNLRKRVGRSRRSVKNYHSFQLLRADKYIPVDVTSPLYSGMTGNILLGTEEEEKYTEMLLKDAANAEPARGKRIYWMHTIPYWSGAVRELLNFSEEAQIVGCELAQTCDMDIDAEDPYEAMAIRMVCNELNGHVGRRIEAGIKHALEVRADGVVWFCHWGCKRTLGGAQLAKKKFEEAGLPLLILDGDGCDPSHGGEGQTSTRLGAFLEMLNGGSADE